MVRISDELQRMLRRINDLETRFGEPPAASPRPTQGGEAPTFAQVLGEQYGPVRPTAPGARPDLEPLIRRAAAAHGVRPELLRAVIQVESGGNPQAISPCGAQGLMQLMPGTASALGVTDAFNTEQNVMGGARYLRQQLDRFGGDETLALAAYNAGPGAVARYRGVPPYRETQQYVQRVLSLASSEE